MNIFRSRFLMVASLAGTAGLLMNVNCGGSSGGGTGGTGGTTSTGGKGGTGTGGTSTGGKGGTGTGGTTSTGGAGGATATGGTAGSGTGGTAGSGAGGTAGAKGGNGGSSNTDGGTQQFAAFLYTFDKNVEGWGMNTGNTSSGNLSNVDGGIKPVLAWDNSVGSTGTTPTGSLKLDATYSDYLQFAQAVVNIQPTVNATGKEVSVYVMLDAEDGGATWPGNVQVSASTGSSYNGFTQTIKSVTAGQWMKVEVPLTGVASPFDPTQLIQIGVEFTTYSKPEGGTFGPPQHRTFHIDTVTDGTNLPAAPPVDYTFDTATSVQAWQLATNITTPDGGTGPALSWDSAGGDSGGALKVAAEFNGYKQQWSANVHPQPFVDLTGKTITARIKLDSGALPSTTSNYVQLHASSGSTFVYANSPTGASFSTTSAGTYMTLTFNFGTGFTPPTGYDVTQISEIGIQVGINGGPDGGTFPTPTPLTFHIDSVIEQ